MKTWLAAELSALAVVPDESPMSAAQSEVAAVTVYNPAASISQILQPVDRPRLPLSPAMAL